MIDGLQAMLGKFQADTTARERKRWRPLYRLLTQKERQLRKDRMGLSDKAARTAARAQYELVKELLAVAPSPHEPAGRRPRKAPRETA